MSLFNDYSIEKYKSNKPPADNSFQTAQEIKQLAKTPINKKFITEKDDVAGSFKKTAEKAGVEFPKDLVKKLVNDSSSPIMKLKRYFKRPRPGALAKKMNVKLETVKLNSMRTPAYPSGHSAQGYLIGSALSKMYPKAKSQFMKTAKDISDSRNSARAHYKSDSVFGKKLGLDMYNHIKDEI